MNTKNNLAINLIRAKESLMSNRTYEAFYRVPDSNTIYSSNRRETEEEALRALKEVLRIEGVEHEIGDN
jgi:hypothetical protein